MSRFGVMTYGGRVDVISMEGENTVSGVKFGLLNFSKVVGV